jgi:hypothetical protein
MQFNADAVTQIYLGADRACRCGCKGNYLNRGEAGFDRRLRRFARMWENYVPGDDDVGSSYLNIRYGNNRAMAVYFD